MNFFERLRNHKAEVISSLPAIHRPDGARPLHDDFPWPLCYLPRWLLAAPQGKPPRMLFGNQNYWNTEEFSGIDSFREIERIRGYKEWPRWGPKPIPPAEGKWQLSIVYPRILGKIVPGPYFAFTLKSGWHFRIGWARWSEGGQERYYELFPIAIRKFNS